MTLAKRHDMSSSPNDIEVVDYFHYKQQLFLKIHISKIQSEYFNFNFVFFLP